MFLLCPLPRIKILCNVPPFLNLCELWCYNIVFPVHVRWDYIKNVSCFLQKKICVQNISHVYYNDIMNCKQVLSHIMFAYQTTCERIDDWSILLLCKIWPTTGVLSKNLIFILSFYFGECPNVLKKDWLWPNLSCWGLPEVLEIFFGSSMWLLLEEKTMTAPLLN
jgi:hypothetical protein